jgi:hypothetical protein
MSPTASRHQQGLTFFVRRAAASWQLHIYVLALQKNRRLGGEPMIVFDSVTESVEFVTSHVVLVEIRPDGQRRMARPSPVCRGTFDRQAATATRPP